MIWQLLSWYFLLMLLGWVTFPLAYHLFRKLPGRGFTLSRILGLLLWGFFFWLLSWLGILQNNKGGILLALFLVMLLSIWAGWKRWREIWDWMKDHWRLALAAESVFLLSFTFMALVRSSNPDATGTEKPMELAFINSILNSQTFPPHDPWLSGYSISYYHFGYILAGMLAKLTSTSGGVAFNLALISTFSLSALGAYGVVYNLLVSFGKTIKEKINSLFWALLGPLFLLFISNLEGVLEILHQAGVGWNPDSGGSRFWQWINIESLNSPPSRPLTLIPQRFWWWWQASRVVQDIDLLGNVSGLSPIDEFPAFSFVLGDLHPHVLVMPFVMLLIGIALAVFRGGMDHEGRLLGSSWPYRWDMFLVSVVTLGGIAFLNTWDLPVYFTLLVGAFLFQRVMTRGWDKDRFWDVLKLAIPLGIISLLIYFPFFISFQSQAGGILPNLIYPTRGLYLWLMFGTLFVPIILFFIWLLRRRGKGAWGWGAGLTGLLILFLVVFSLGLGFRLAQTQAGQQLITSQGASSFIGLLSSAAVHRLGYGITLVTLALLLVTGLAFLIGMTRKGQENPHFSGPIPFVLLMVVLGGVMVLAPEFVYLRDNFGARMNTIFKFYYQAWMLWSLSASFAAVVILKKGGWLSRVIIIVFMISGLVYPVLAYPSKTNNFDPVDGYSLDASGYFQRYSPNEAAAIEWLSDAPLGVVAEAVGGQYSGFARVSTLTGQPGVLGWPGHEGQWRGGYEEVGSREGDLRTLYESMNWETALSIIRQYDIRYIYIGSLELSTYSVNPIKFDNNLGMGYAQGGVMIYEVPEPLWVE